MPSSSSTSPSPASTAASTVESTGPWSPEPFPNRALDELVAGAMGCRISRLDPMPGGASIRRYFRVTTPRGTAIATYSPNGGAPEEVTAGRQRARWAFIEIRELLASRGVRVPALLGENCAAGLLLLEDLGDLTLAEALKRSPDRKQSLYRRAVRDLASMHALLADPGVDSVVATRAFDETLLRWELEHFVEYALDARGVHRTPGARHALGEAFDHIARDLARRPRGFVHRDYQSRNLMIDPHGASRGDPDALVVIDFQDALLGPRAYDLVALLNDSYQNHSDELVGDMLHEYADASSFGAVARAELRDEFDRLTVQRKLKDAGRFIYVDRKNGNPAFLPYVATSLGRARRALGRLAYDPVFARVSALLAEALPGEFGLTEPAPVGRW